ncbi:MAG: hypothetical protein WBQ34_12220 [Candidatus Acidiferrales bacterium]
MASASVFQRVFRKVYGKPCWGVKQGYGSFLTFEFGKPHLVVREPIVASKSASLKVRRALARRQAHPRGQWHLWIYCCNWKVLSHGKRVGDNSTNVKIRRAAKLLNGQKLTGFSISRGKLECVFQFDLGGTLITRPFDKRLEQWLLYEPSGRVLVLRADGRYKYARSDVPESDGDWKTYCKSP